MTINSNLKISSDKHSFLSVITFMQIVSLLVFLYLCVINVGLEANVGVVWLGAFASLSIVFFSFILFYRIANIYIRFHFFFFILFVFWLAVKIAIDLGELKVLAGLLIGDSDGVLFFYIIGSLLGLSSYHRLICQGHGDFEKIILSVFFLILLWVYFEFSPRLRSDIFLLEGINGAYQRPANFISIAHIIASFLYLQLVLKKLNIHSINISNLLWKIAYTLIAIINLALVQVIGSDMGLAVILGVSLITLVITFSVQNPNVKQKLLSSSPWFWSMFKWMLINSFFAILFFSIILSVIIYVMDFNLLRIELLGFYALPDSDVGAVLLSNSSLSSRANIIAETGLDQLSFMPVFGSMEVEYLAGYGEGYYIHSFFLYIFSHLGLIGLLLVLLLVLLVLIQLYFELKVDELNLISYQYRVTALFSIFIFLYLIFLANLGTTLFWSPLLFVLGFVSKPFIIKSI